MTENIPLLRLQNTWTECERHVDRLFSAMSVLNPLWPLTAERYAHLSNEQIQAMDQFVFRFTKLQDAIGGRFLPALLQYLEEPYDNRPMLDKLNRLEKMGCIESVAKWQEIRAVRNLLAHDYPDDPGRNAASLNRACEAACDLYDILKRVSAKFTQEHSDVSLGRPLPDGCLLPLGGAPADIRDRLRLS